MRPGAPLEWGLVSSPQAPDDLARRADPPPGDAARTLAREGRRWRRRSGELGAYTTAHLVHLEAELLPKADDFLGLTPKLKAEALKRIREVGLDEDQFRAATPGHMLPAWQALADTIKDWGGSTKTSTGHTVERKPA